MPGVHGLTGGEPGEDLGRTVAKPLASDLDQRPTVGLEGVARVEVGGAVGADDLPVRTAG